VRGIWEAKSIMAYPFFEDLQIWMNRATVLHAMEAWKNLTLKFELPVIDLSVKKEDCEDPDQTSGGDDCEDP
jgi:hypothetical protein